MGVTSSVSEILVLSKTAKFPLSVTILYILPYIILYFIFLLHLSYFNNSIDNCELIASNKTLPLDYAIIKVATDALHVLLYL